MINNFGVIARWWLLAAWRMQPGRWIVAIIAIASGVAMALAIHLVNGSALDEFRDAIARVNGNAQLQLVSSAGLFDESVWPVVASAPEVAQASPVLDLRLGSSRQDAYRVVGVDVLRAAAVTPALLPTPATAETDRGSLSALFAADQVFLSEQSRRQFGSPANGDSIELIVGLSKVRLEVAGSVDLDDRILLTDLATAQWRFNALGRLSRIDLRLDPTLPKAIAIGRLHDRLTRAGFKGLELLEPDASVQRMSNLSRAYRVNLAVLALVALFTGAFLVWTALTLAVRRQRAVLALLGVLGMPPSRVTALVALQGLTVALTGSLLGIGLGVLAAQGLLLTVGGDLGGGYFSGTARLRIFFKEYLQRLLIHNHRDTRF
jgi:putative ABC transport system permease protein